MTEQMSWAEYREAHAVTGDEQGAAFFAYLKYLTGGEWDDDFRRADPDGEG